MSYSFRFVADFVLRLVVQEIHNESNKWSTTFTVFSVTVIGLSIALYTAAAIISERYLLSPVRLSVVCLSSETLVHPTQAVDIFGNISTAFGTLAIRRHSHKILRRSSQGNPSAGELSTRGVVKYRNFEPIEGYISETVQDRS